MTTAPRTGFVLTGRHVLACLLLFFLTVSSVNFYMARVAIQTFSGLEAAKPYQEGLKYDDEIARARAQERRGWKVDARVSPAQDGYVTVDVRQADAAGLSTPGLVFTATFLHPADRRRDVTLELIKMDAGRYIAPVALPDGRWDLRIEARGTSETLFRSQSRIEIVR